MICNLHPDRPKDVAAFMDIVTGYGRNLDSTGVSVAMEWLLKLDKTQQANLMRVWCSTAFSPGEQLEAGSPVDASFYPIHPTMERLLHYKRMVNDFDNIAWENTVTEEGTVYCTQGDSGYFAQEYFDIDIFNDTDCMGHHAVDLTIFSSTWKGDDGSLTSRP